MKRIRPVIAILVGLITTMSAFAQKPDIIRNYIETYKDLAIAEMQRTGVPASITLAQGIHETLAGTSDLVQRSNNHFGIKCKSNWTGETVFHDDDAKGECFRKYARAEDSYRDHSDFLRNSARYAALFSLDPADYSGWANGLKKAGYATNPRYPQVLIKLIEDYNLQQYTFQALNRPNDVVVKDEPAAPGHDNDEGTARTNAVTPPTEEADSAPVITYPTGVFHLNETKVVFVKKGTPYLAIAKEHSVSLGKLFEFNEIQQAEVTPSDQLVYLQRKRKTGLNDSHVVRYNESLHDIAQEEAIRIDALMELNWLNDGDMPAIGERLSLKSKSGTMPRLALKNNYSLQPGAIINSKN